MKKELSKPHRSSKKLDASVELGLQNYQHGDPFGELLGYEVLELNSKKHTAKVGLELRRDHLSPARRVHGGVVSALFDFSCGAAVFTTLGPHDFCSTVELKVNFFRPLNEGDSLVAESRVVFLGKRLCVVESFLFKKGMKEPAGMATATFNVVHQATAKRLQKGA